MKPINSKVEQITPAMAEEYLKKNISNRNVRSAHVDRLKQEMLANRWLVTHQGIAFDEYGNLLDGQHRLIACAMSGKTVPMMVTRGLESKHNGHDIYTMDVVDCGRPRTTADQLKLMHGFGNATLAVATCRMIAVACVGGQGSRVQSLTVGQTLPILAIYGEAFSALLEFAGERKIGKLSYVIAPLCMGYFLDKSMALEFMDGLSSGENIKRGEPIYALRELLISKRASRGAAAARRNLMESTANCFYHAIKGKEVLVAKPGLQGIDYLLAKQKKNVEAVLTILNRKSSK